MAHLLLQKGIETFCPLHEVKRRWSDRIKLVQHPILPTYVFVKIQEDQRTTVRTTPGVLNFVVTNCKPVAIKDKTIQKIRQFQEKYQYLEVRPAFEQCSIGAHTARRNGKFYMECLDLLLIGYNSLHRKADIKDKNH